MHPPIHRRTGKLPLNAEAPAEILLTEDITPVKNFYVRCHGTEPDLEWEKHAIEISVDNNVVHRLTMEELEKEFSPVTIRNTMACDGNRRKELNVIKRTNGFDWGCCAVSTGSFTGALLRDVLLRFTTITDKHRFVVFESADTLVKGNYVTSLPLAVVMQPDSDFLIAYLMNGERLTKEHGFPVRTILPGYVGGRTVKWLARIRLAEEDPESYYHVHDNAVFPSNVTSTGLLSKVISDHNKLYKEEKLGMINSPRHPYILYELNINSATLTPKHGHCIKIDSNMEELIEFAGYAYDGGGRKIVRVEVTLDGGDTWEQCSVEYPKDYQPHRGYKWYVLCRWRIHLPVWRLASSKWISVRAWNQSMNTQPEKHSWNILGMMNNAWYKIQLSRTCANRIDVLHPVSMDHSGPLGWMERRMPAARYQESHIPPATYTREEVQHHNSLTDCWVIIGNVVYDLTDFLNLHPGGQASILAHAGEDVTNLFFDIHSEDTHVFKASYAIGKIAEEDTEEDETAARHRHPFLYVKHPRRTPDGHDIELNSSKWTKVTLKDKIIVNHDVRRFVFALSSPDKRMWLPWGKHIKIGVELQDRMVVRPYTPVKPILAQEDNGTFEMVIKIYFPTDQRPGGEMTMMLENMQIGDQVRMKGPEGVLWYFGKGQFCLHGHFFYCDKLNFIVGGTGVTPALAILRAMLVAEKLTHSEICLVFANKTQEDIMCLEELDDFVNASPNVKICHVLSRGPLPTNLPSSPQISFLSGLVNADVLQEHLIPAERQASCFICGPPAFIAKAVLPGLSKLGFDDNHIFEF